MRIIKISPHIIKLEFWLGLKMSAWIVQDHNDVYIIDTGLSFMAKRIWQEANKRGEIKAILLTHGHSDHAGGVNSMLQLLEPETPIIAHHLDIPFMEGKEPFPGRKKAEYIVKPHTVTPLVHNDDGSLLSIGPLLPYHTPGHSPGHVVYYHVEDEVLLGGDLFTSRGGNLQKPMKQFTANMSQAIASGEIVAQLKPKLVSIAHSKDVSNPYEQIERYLSEMT